MADVRSMLRAERASRRITHPNASYTSDGKLLCNLCEVLVKSDAAWQGHLHSTGHTLRLNRAQEAASARGTDTSGKKRKASSLESPSAEERKRAKPTETPHDDDVPADVVAEEDRIDTPATPIRTSTTGEQVIVTASGTEADLPPAADSVDDAELAAFERELAEMEASAQAATALTAGATISAAPMTAEELAAQAREEQSSQRGRRDAEIEAEREDATRSLEDEFEEMEGLEERVRKLRQRREALRKGSMEGGDPAGDAAALRPEPAVNGHDAAQQDDDEDEDDEYDEWGFGGGR
ncbi:hypothetical protein LTR36_006527 [Oleoguttula mirabilis]|uniref:Coiled-coil domain-containing protein 16 n=1 Tax=Oleoguttula mirabilis TaxID=1507867 RepID=A0AAV9JWS4_9PEZI|nr:hypothetical protein LTR36_006527 [Oleoguttula mirabilis]